MQTSSTAGCSTVVVIMCRRWELAFVVPTIAALLLSVAHDVNRICFGSTPPSCSAMSRRASATASATPRAGSYIELGLK